MAATDKTYRSQRTLDIVFAVTCILMLLSVVWMLVADYNREYKAVQRDFRDVESVLDERQMLAALPDRDEVEAAQKAVEDRRKALDAAKEKVKAKDQELTAVRDKVTAEYRAIKADFDSKSSFYNIEVEERDQAGLRPEVRRERAERVEARARELKDLGDRLDAAQKAVEKADADYKREVTDPVAQADNDLSDAEDAQKKLTANFDRFAKLTVQKEWGLGDAFRALPILDAFESPTKIKQIVLADLPIEYGSFKYVTRYDRCTSCHLAVDRTGFDKAALTKLTRAEKESGAAWRESAIAAANDLAALVPQLSDEDAHKKAHKDLADAEALLNKAERNHYISADDDPADVSAKLGDVLRYLRESEVPGAKDYGSLDEELARTRDLGAQLQEARSLPRKLETARRILQARKDQGDSLGFDPGSLPSTWVPVHLTPGQITQFESHPRLDLFVDSNSPHPMEKFGCSICHAGQGSATDFQLASHTPADTRQQVKWEGDYHWHATSQHDWEFPMLSSRFVESSCLKCHHEVTDMVRQGSKEEAPKLLRGFNLVRENGCFGCHEIAGVKSGREVGPDLRLEPQPALEWLSPTEQDRAKADPLNPPGTYRKVGPSLRRLAEKTNEEWARRWIQSPRGFRPDTKMPHFYNLSNDAPDLLSEDQRDFPAAEIHSIAHYLLSESAAGLKGEDAYRVALEGRIKELHDRLKTPPADAAQAPLDDKERKELIDATRKLSDLALLSIPMHAPEIDALTARLRGAQDAVFEQYEKINLKAEQVKELKKRQDELQKKNAAPDSHDGKELQKVTAELDQAQNDEDSAKTDLDKAKNDLDPLFQQLVKAGASVPIKDQVVDSQYEPVKDALPEPNKDRLPEGRRLFTERGCLACHVHDGVRQKTADNIPAVPEAAANFAPDLSRVAAKIAPKTGNKEEDAKARRRWVVQWVLNPNIHHPRTRMPITHLTVQQACDVADWLLSQTVEEPADWPKDPPEPAAPTLVNLARVYLAKAPGMTSARLEEMLPADAADLDKVHGYSPDDLKYVAADADERILQGEITTDKLERYIGKKSIGRLGCYGCHDVPGFEAAKPIGTALNDWGKKDAERLAFEDADAYVRDHYHIVDARDAAGDKTKADPLWHAQGGRPPYEKLFYDALEHHTREGFLHQKLEEPRSYDYHRIRAWDDRLRMPQFRFGRSRRMPGESDEAYEIRQEREEGEAREAVMTFVLGLVAEPIPLKYVYTPGPDRLAEAQGRKVLDKYNCVGCHQVRPGVYEFRPTKESLGALEKVYQQYVSDNEKADHIFPGHNAWTGVASPWPDRLVAHGTQAAVKEQEEGPDLLNLRLTEALRFTNNDKIVRDVPAGMTVRLPPEAVFDKAPPYGGAFAELLIPYLAQANETLYKGKPDDARSVLPPPLVREGERVQPKWLYQFLLNPGTVRPQERMRLRMPRFNMSGEEAMTLVNYFGAADKLGNPGAGLTYPYLTIEQADAKYWRDRNEDYLKRLEALAGPDGKGLDQRAKDLVTSLKAGVQLRLDTAKAAAMTAQGDDKARKEQEAKDLQATIDRWDKALKDNNFADLINEWKAGAKESQEAYAADAYRLVAANPNICAKCHSIGSLKIEGANGPDLSIAFERLRPEWTQMWIGNPERLFAYKPTMPQNFPRDSLEYKEFFAGDPRDRVRAARDVLMDLPRLENLPANRATREAVTGGK